MFVRITHKLSFFILSCISDLPSAPVVDWWKDLLLWGEGRDLTRETSVFLKELKSLHFYGPISL